MEIKLQYEYNKQNIDIVDGVFTIDRKHNTYTLTMILPRYIRNYKKFLEEYIASETHEYIHSEIHTEKMSLLDNEITVLEFCGTSETNSIYID